MSYEWLLNNVTGVLLGLFGGGGLVTIILGFLNKGKTSAEAKKIAAEANQIQFDTAQKFVKSLSSEIDVLRKELKILSEKYETLNHKYIRLEDENHRLKFELDVLGRTNDELSGIIKKYNLDS